ncbi:hypothetical protein Tco_0923166 [Tanacetum coccineum]|uniref:Uncharacterized protein n=1 Tax=Tanacetum coccineum TaxID=301880 RepID=A0ABQ5D323_9ASTR
MESSDQFICFFCGSLSDEYGCPCSTCELCGNDAHYGYDCPSQVPFVYNQDPCFNQNLDNFPQTSPSFPQQYLCCEDCGGPHATFECQPMNQNFYEPNFCYNSNSSGFDQFQPPQYPVIHQPRQEMSTEMLLAKEKLIKAIRTCLKNNNQPPEEKSIAVLLAEKSILTVMQTLEEKQIDTESMQELLLQLSKDLQTLGNTSNQLKQEEQDSSQYWKPPVYYSDDDDDFYRESIDETPPSDAITPDLPITDSLVMEDEHLDTIPETDSDEEIESSVENLNLTPSESEDLSDYVSECDLPFCDNSPDFNNDSEIFSNPLFDSNADYTSSDDESSSEEDVPVENFKIYSNPLLEFDEEIFSSEINPLYNEVLEDLDSIPPGNENDHFNAESDLIESLLNKDTVITSPNLFDQFQPLQYPVIHQPRQEMSTEMLLAKEKLIKAIRTCLKNNNQPPEEKSIAVLLAEESILTVMQTLEEKKIDTEKSIDETPPSNAITPDLPITDSLVMEDEHLDTISETDSDEEIESNVENLNLTPSEFKDLSDYVSECDLPFCNNSPDFNNDSKIFSNPLFDSNVDYTSSDDESSSKEDVSVENFKIYSNPLLEFDEEIFSSEINPLYNKVLEDLDSIPTGNENDHFNAEFDLIESLLNKYTVITSPKIDFLLEEFTGELSLINPIPPGIAETNFDPKEAIHLIKNGSSTIHIDISLPEYESFDDESDSASEIFNDDLAHIISPSEYEYVYADDESDSGDLTTDVVEDILGDSTRKLQMSHRGFKALKISHNFFNKSPMMIYGGDMPILDVPYLHFYPP